MISKQASQNYEFVRQNILQEACKRQNTDPKGTIITWFEDYMFKLSIDGWKRGDIYYLLLDILNNDPKIPEIYENELWEYETALLGNCAPECIIKLYGDPENIDNLTAFVRGTQWK